MLHTIRCVLTATVLLGLATASLVAFAQTDSPTEPMVAVGPEDASAGATEVVSEPQPTGETETIPTEDLWSIIRDGGPLMIPIGICSLILVAFVFERAISLRLSRVIPGPFVKRFLKQLREGELDREKAIQLCYDNGSPVAEVFSGAVRKWGRPAVEVEQAIIDAGERATNGLRRYLRVINGVATVTPLLGLLGTVVGMIRAFNNIATADALGRPELLAKGISEALLTTAAGLTVAIPALIFYLFFVSRVDRLIIGIDALGQEIVHVIAAEGIEENAAKKARAAKSRSGEKKESAA
ncbi:MAG TPA: MotA/TolQ/ExbB proton channel family protein [Thermoguttaceae bacterium]|nr:MotA/TolQ/ExbB proton channel family protein [Thermoguttaceae bacterium]